MLRSGLLWEMLPPEMSCGWGDELLAPLALLAGGRCLGATASGAAGAAVRGRADRLEPDRSGQCVCPGQKVGSTTGPNLLGPRFPRHIRGSRLRSSARRKGRYPSLGFAVHYAIAKP